MRKILGQQFFNRNSKIVAQDLLGKFLVKKLNGKEISTLITETEAYDGTHDLANHASKGKTKRTEILFGNPGYFYVYLVYGMHYMLNVVADKKDYPGAVLIRGVKGANGPGKVTKFLKIDRKLHGKVSGKTSNIWLEDRGIKIKKILKTPRIGVNYAGPVWSKKKMRYELTNYTNNTNGYK